LTLTLNLNVNATVDVVVDHATSGSVGRYRRHAQLPEASSLSKRDRVPRAGTCGELPKGHAKLADQLLRAAQSQPRNIAEGAGRRTTVDQARFYTHARHSAMEAAAALDTLRVMKLVSETMYARGIDLLEGVVAMLTKMT
jgi:four helix bundle protein